MVQDTPVNVRQEFMMEPIISPLLVNLEKAREALEAALQVGKAVTQPPLNFSLPRLLLRRAR